MLQHSDLVVDRDGIPDSEEERSQISAADDAALLVCLPFYKHVVSSLTGIENYGL